MKMKNWFLKIFIKANKKSNINVDVGNNGERNTNNIPTEVSSVDRIISFSHFNKINKWLNSLFNYIISFIKFRKWD